MSEPNLTENIDNNNVTPSDNSNNNVETKSDVPKDDSDVSPSSGVSSASSKSAVSKQSGIRPPSRIGRPCGGIQKPAIPSTPTKNSSDDSIRRLTDDFGRHRLTDLMEMDESEEDSLDYLKCLPRRNRYSSIGSTASSMEGLWDLHPRRLSEAGLSRHSDSSAVLTEDTDSFMIGQRIWVGGTKPGTIAFIGETQFAPGEWAGIALDEPIGKNDGSVAGVRYFQCENKKGVFSRLTRLTREPLEQPGMGSSETFVSPTNGIRRSPISPTGSTRSLLKSAASLSNSNTSLSSSATHHIDFKIGDRVIIKSTQGSKVGTVRYMGLTDFAPGEWVGVELDDPRGKNDGSVEGKRYFECRPHFGLFAPISKVSKSPSKHKPGACVVHSGGPGLPPSGIRRANSRESMTSLASRTSAASSVRRVRLGVTSLTPKKVTPKTSSTPIPTRTALQDVLREKQQHIEQLLKERELERAEITRAASQADEAEQKFYTLKLEFEQMELHVTDWRKFEKRHSQTRRLGVANVSNSIMGAQKLRYRAACEQKVRESDEFLAKLKVDRDELLNQLEDEKRRNEDLQFRFEEAAITKSDIEVTSEGYLKKIKELEAKLEEERQKAEQLEPTSNKLFEAEENLIKAREEIEAVRREYDQVLKKEETLAQDNVSSTKLLEELKKEVEGAKAENEEKTKTITELNDKVQKSRAEYESAKREVEECKKNADENCGQRDVQLEQLKFELEHQKKILQKYEQAHAELAKDNEKLKMDLGAKSHDLEVANEQISAKDKEIKSLREELENVKKELGEKIEDLERHKGNLNEVENNLRKDLDETRDELKAKITEVENVKKECSIQVSQKDQQITEANNTITKNSEEIKKLTQDLEDIKKTFDESKNEIHSRHARQVASQDAQLMALSAEIQQKNEEITKSSIVISKLEEDLCAKNSIIEKLRLELESCTIQQSSQTDETAALNQKLHDLSLINGDLQRQLSSATARINELLELKQRLEVQMQGLTAQCENAGQLEQLRAEIQQRENMLNGAKAELEQKLQNSERLRHEIELQRQQDLNNFQQFKSELEAKLNVYVQSEELLKQRCDASIAELSKSRDQYLPRISELERIVQEKDLAVINLQNKCSETVRQYQEQIQALNDELNRRLQECQQKISGYNDETGRLKEELARKTEELIQSRAECSHILAQNQQSINEVRQKCNEDTKQLQFDLNEKGVQLEKALTQINLFKTECQNTNTDLTVKLDQISELSAQLKGAQNLINQLQEELTAAKLRQQQTIHEHENVQNQCRGLLDQVGLLTQQVKNGDALFKDLETEHRNAQLLIAQLRITEQQKQQCLQQLQLQTVSSGDKNCDQVLQLLNQVKVDNGTENTEKILNLQRDLDLLRNQLAERNHQFDLQQSELLQLQQELLKAQQAPSVGGPPEPNSVSLNFTDTTQQHNTVHATPPSHIMGLQVQISTRRHSYAQLASLLDVLRKENAHLLVQLRNALNNGNQQDVYTVLQNLTKVNQQFSNFKIEMQADKGKLEKTLQYVMLQLQEKDRSLINQNIQIKYLEDSIRSLPFQCKKFAVPGDNVNVNECFELSVDNKKLEDMLRNKDNQIQNLRNEIGSVEVECSNFKPPNQIYVPQPCLCPEAQIKKIVVPAPPKIIRVMVPIVKPEPVIQYVRVPQVNGNTCPPPKIVEVPKIVIQKVPFEIQVPAKCIFPDLSSLYNCGSLEQSFNTMNFPNYSPSEIFKFKQSLLSLITRQKNCMAASVVLNLPKLTVPQSCQTPASIIDSLVINGYSSSVNSFKESLLQLLQNVHNCAVTSKNNNETVQVNTINCPKLPVLTVSDSCLTPAAIISSINIEGYSPSDTFSYQQSLLQVLRKLQDCVQRNSNYYLQQNCSSLPLLEVPQNCISPLQYIQNLAVPGFYSDDIAVFKKSLLDVIDKLKNCNPWSSGRQDITRQNIKQTCGLPRLPTFNVCLTPLEIINHLNLKTFSQSDSELFKKTLLELLSLQQKCCNKPSQVVEKPVYIRIPPRIVIKQVPIPVPQPPKILIKQVYVPASTPCRPIIQQVPVKYPVPVKINVPVRIPVTKSCHLPKINVFDCSSPLSGVQALDLSGYSHTDVSLFKESLLSLITTQRSCNVEVRPEVPPVNLQPSVPITPRKHYSDVVPNNRVDQETPRVLIKKVPYKVFVRVPVPGNCHLPLLDINSSTNLQNQIDSLDIKDFNLNEVSRFKQNLYSLLTQQRNCIQCTLPDVNINGCEALDQQIALWNFTGYNSWDIEIFKQKLLSILTQQRQCSLPNQTTPQVLIRQVPVPVPQPPKIVIKQIPIIAKCDNKPTIIIKEKPVLVPQPPRIIIQQVRVPENQSTPKPQCHLPKVFIQGCDNLETQVESVLISGFDSFETMNYKRNLLMMLLEQRKCGQSTVSQKEPVIVRVPVRVPVKVEVPILQPPKIILKEVPTNCDQNITAGVYCRLPRLNMNSCDDIQNAVTTLSLPNHNQFELELFKEDLMKLLSVQRNCVATQPPKVIVREVPVQVPPKIIVRKVPVLSNCDQNVSAGVYCRLPKLNTNSCDGIQNAVSTLSLPNHNQFELELFKQDLMKLLSIQRNCVATQTPKVIVREVPVKVPPKIIVRKVPVLSNCDQNVSAGVYCRLPRLHASSCGDIQNAITTLFLPNYDQVELELFKTGLMRLLSIQRNCGGCNLPHLNYVGCEELQAQIQKLDFHNHSLTEAERFKKELIYILLKQRECIQTPQGTTQNVTENVFPPTGDNRCVPQLVEVPKEVIREVKVYVPQPPRVVIRQVPVPIRNENCDYQPNLHNGYLTPRRSFSGDVKTHCHLPIINVNSCEDVRSEIDSLDLSNFDSAEVLNFKRNLLFSFTRQRNCIQCRLPQVNINSCENLQNQVDSINLSKYNSWDVQNYKQNLLNLLLNQRRCVQQPECQPKIIKVPVDRPIYHRIPIRIPVQKIVEVPKEVTREVKVPIYIQVPVRIPVKQFIEVPKEVVREVRVPVKEIVEVPKEVVKYVKIPVSQPPETVIREVPVAVPQPPKVIIKQVPVFTKCDHKPTIIVREKPVPVQVPIKVNVPCSASATAQCHLPEINFSNLNTCSGDIRNQIASLTVTGYNGDEIERFKENLLMAFVQQRDCNQCKLPYLGIVSGCEDLQKQVDLLHIQNSNPFEVQTFKQNLLTVLLSQRNCVKQPECLPKIIKVPVDRLIYKQVPIEVPVRQIVEVPKEVIREVKVPVYKQIPIRVPVKQIIEVPKEVIREVKVYVPQPPKVVVRQIPVPIRSDNCDYQPDGINNGDFTPRRSFSGDVKTHCHLPIINVNSCEDVRSEIDSLDLSNFDSAEVLNFKRNLLFSFTRQRNCIQCRLPQVNINSCENLQNQVDSINLSNYNSWDVQNYKKNLLNLLLSQRSCVQQLECQPKIIKVPVDRPIYHRIPVRIPEKQIIEVPKEVTREVKVPVYIQVPVRIPVKQFIDVPKEVVREVRVPVKEIVEVPKEVVKYVKIPISQPPETVIREVPVPVPQPPKVIIKQVPVFTKCDHKPTIIVREKPVPVQIPVKVNVPCSTSATAQCHLPEINFSNLNTCSGDIRNQIASLTVTGYNADEIERFKENLLMAFVQQRDCNQCKLPYLGIVSGCDDLQKQVDLLHIQNSNPLEIQTFKQNLLTVLLSQRNCMKQPDCLPKIIKVPVDRVIYKQVPVQVPVKQIVEVPKEVIKEVKVPVYRQIPIRIPIKQIVEVPKEIIRIVKVPVRPLETLNNCLLPSLDLSPCGNVQNEIEALVMPGYDLQKVNSFKQKLVWLLLQQRNCVECKLPNLSVSGCQDIQDQVESLDIQHYNAWDAQIFKHNLITILLDQRRCVQQPECQPKIIKVPVDRPIYHRIPVKMPERQIIEVPREVTREVKVPVYIQVPVRIPVKQFIEVPKEVVREVRVPVKEIVEVPKEVVKYVKIPVSQPPETVIKEVPVAVPQPPKVIIKQVPVFTKCDHKPTIIVREKPVPVQIPVRPLIKPVPVILPCSASAAAQCHLPEINFGNLNTCGDIRNQIASLTISGYNIEEIERFKEKLLMAFVQQRDCNQCKLPYLGIVSGCEDLQKQVDLLNVQNSNPLEVQTFKQNLLTVLLSQRNCVKQPECLPKIIKVPVDRPIYKQVPIEVPVKQIVEVPKEVIREVKVPVYKQIPVRVPVKQIVEVPKVVIREVKVPVPCKCLLPSLDLNACGDIENEIEALPIPDYDLQQVYVFKQKLLLLLLQHRKCVPRRFPSPSISSQCRLPFINFNNCGNIQSQVESLTVSGYNPEEVQRYKQNLISVLLTQRNCVKCHLPEFNINSCDGVEDRIAAINLPNYNIAEVEKFKENLFSMLINQQRCAIQPSYNVPSTPPSGNLVDEEEGREPWINMRKLPVSCQPKILIKEVPVPVPQAPKIIVRQVPVQTKCDHKPNIIIKQIPVPVPTPPRVIFNQVPVASDCQLPNISLATCEALDTQLEMLQITGYSSEEVIRFKQNLYTSIMQQINCRSSGQECHLPFINIQGCIQLENQIGALFIPNINEAEVQTFKQNLLSIIRQQQNCQTPLQNVDTMQVPRRVKPQLVPDVVPSADCYLPQPNLNNCEDVENLIGRLSLTNCNSIQVTKFIQQLLSSITQKGMCNIPLTPHIIEEPPDISLTPIVPTSTKPVCYLPRLDIHGCDLQSQIESLNLPNYDSNSVTVFKENLLSVFLEQRKCVQPKIIQVPQFIVREVPRYIYPKTPAPIVTNYDEQPVREIPDCPTSRVIINQVPVEKKVFIRLPCNSQSGNNTDVPELLKPVVPVPTPIRVPVYVRVPQIVEKPVPNCRACPPPKVIIQKVPQNNSVQMCAIPNLSPPNTCDSPENILSRVFLGGFESNNFDLFKNNLLQLLKQQQRCCQFSPRKYLCRTHRNRLLERIRFYGSQLCRYKKMIRQWQLRYRHVMNSHLGNLQGNNQLPAVPFPMLHVMKSLAPSVPVSSFQHVSTISSTNSFVKNLNQAYRHTQGALQHCMDAILAQSLTHSLINAKCKNCQQLIQDRELAENQIKFLNSIIVDMQRKTEEQRARIEILESGCSPAMADELKLIGSSTRQVPPRVYCDICEEFDLHETEDCPQQNTDVVPANNGKHREHKHAEERPYCEICEEFGHATEDCPEDETF